MNILVIGNGFDLAHGLPTKYSDFLDFIAILGFDSIQKNYTEITKEQKPMYLSNDECKTEKMKGIINQLNSKDEIKVQINNIIGFDEKIVSEENNRSNTISYKNYWIEHFFKRRNKIGENWIDFEQEIAYVLGKLEYRNNVFNNIFFEILEFYERELKEQKLEEQEKEFKRILNECIECYEGEVPIYAYYNDLNPIYSDIKYNYLRTNNGAIHKWWNIHNKYINIISAKLSKDLDNLILAFELYLKLVIEEMPVQGNHADILNIGKIDKVISFNYTHTIKNYKIDATDVDYIHGEVRENVDLNNNMVLGVDEYLSDDKKNKNLNFIHFKKYFQRIYKNTGAEYKNWLTTKDSNIYFFGHSLDSSDKDILKELLECENAKIKIFYFSEEQKATQISNIVKIIGQGKLIDYTYNKKKSDYEAKIQFIKQEHKLCNNSLEKNLQQFTNFLCILIDKFFLEEQKDDKEIFMERIKEIKNTTNNKNIEKLNELIKDFEEKLK